MTICIPYICYNKRLKVLYSLLKREMLFPQFGDWKEKLSA